MSKGKSMATHNEVAAACATDELAVPASSHVVRRTQECAWRVESRGVWHVEGIAAGQVLEIDTVFRKLGWLVRKGNSPPANAPKGFVKCQYVTPTQFLAGQIVSFYALDGTLAVARYQGPAKTGVGIGSLEVWGRQEYSAV